MKVESLWKKLGLIAVLMLILIYAIDRVELLTLDRKDRGTQATRDSVSRWGSPQMIGRVFLKVPQVEKTKPVYYFAPEELQIDAELKNEERYRGIHKLPLYSARVVVSGRFSKPNTATEEGPLQLDWARAEVLAVVDDLQGQKNATVYWNTKAISTTASHTEFTLMPYAFAAKLPPNVSDGGDFKVELSITGSQSLSFLPYAAQTNAKLKGDWARVNFSGDSLPKSRTTDERGFEAAWSYGSRPTYLPHRFSSDTPPVYWKADSGVTVITDVYDANERAVKYGWLFVVMTFATLFILEAVGLERALHPLQYLMIGAAIAIFFLLLLSISERTGFATAYAIATTATTSLIVLYGSVILHSRKRALLLGSVLVSLYAYLFVVLRAEDVALLMGSLGLFVFLAIAMYATRNKNWYGAATPV